MSDRLQDYTLEIYMQDEMFTGALMLPGRPAESVNRVARQHETLADDTRRIWVCVMGGTYPLASIVTLARNWRSAPDARGWKHIDLRLYSWDKCYTRR